MFFILWHFASGKAAQAANDVVETEQTISDLIQRGHPSSVLDLTLGLEGEVRTTNNRKVITSDLIFYFKTPTPFSETKKSLPKRFITFPSSESSWAVNCHVMHEPLNPTLNPHQTKPTQRTLWISPSMDANFCCFGWSWLKRWCSPLSRRQINHRSKLYPQR